MENKLLKQSDIDSLVSELAAKTQPPQPAAPAAPAESPPVHTAEPTPDGAPLAPAVKEISLQQAKQQASSGVTKEQYDLLVSLNDKLVERIQRMENKIQRLEQLEKMKAGGGGIGVTTQQYNEMTTSVQQLNQQIANISARLQGTLGYDIYHTFECEKCGTHEHVATVFRCTQCGHQNWRGW